MNNKPKKSNPGKLVLQEKHDVTTPSGMIAMAITSGADLDKLEKLLTLQERWDANEAKKAYHVSMTAFKANPPQIKKDKKVGYSTTKGPVGYSHATLANVVEMIGSALSEHGLSASWSTKQNGNILVTCKITHAKGHSEETTLGAPADQSGSKNAIQAIGSTVTYLSRYTLLSLTGLAAHDMDDDGKDGTEKKETTVSMPKTAGPTQNKGVHTAKTDDPAKSGQGGAVEDASIVEPSGTISMEEAKALQKLSSEKGYTRDEVYEVIGTLGYTKTVEILKQDYETVLTSFGLSAELWRKNKDNLEKELWEKENA